MLLLIVADTQSARQKHITPFLATLGASEVLRYDDTYGTLTDLEQYLYPSLFSIAPPVIHIKFMLEASTVIENTFLKKLMASPTLFLFEEMALPSPLVTLFKKVGAVIHTEGDIKKVPKGADIFGATLALTATDKKSRWMAYRKALANHPIEAVIGILYWKIRDLATKNPKEKNRYNALYKKMLTAHARAWETGAPLELMIEKVLLSQ